MINCRYCSQPYNNIKDHVYDNNHICSREHKLWKREKNLEKMEKELNTILNQELFIIVPDDTDDIDVLGRVVSWEDFNNASLLSSEISLNSENTEISESSESSQELKNIDILNKYITDIIYKSSSDKDKTCPICLTENTQKDSFCVLKECGHFMCSGCIQELENKEIRQCPICRVDI